MSAYVVSGWSNLAVAGAGAAGALTGLLFVAVSINLSRILKFPQLPARAAGTLGLVTTILLACVVMLAPQGRGALGIEILVLAAAMTAAALRASLPRRHGDQGPPSRVLGPLLLLLHPALLLAGGGISLLVRGGGGFYWILAGICAGFAASMVNTWVLLVEIQR